MKKVCIFFVVLLSFGRISRAYDFSYTYQGKTLYYSIYTRITTSHCVSVVHPYSSYYPGYVSGDVVIPDSVEYNDTMYAVTGISPRAFSYCSDMSSVVIPSAVTSIGGEAFCACSSLTSLTIPDAITRIDTRAFAGCSSLTSITIPESVSVIYQHAFFGCSGLTSIVIPNQVVSIGDYAFQDCSGLTTVTIGASVSNIGAWTFSGCSNLTTMYCNASNPPTANYDPFNGCDFQIYVPCGSVAAYQTAPNWSNYSTNINGMPDFNFNYSFVACDETMGTVSVGRVGCDSNISVTAIVNVGYQFVGWSDGVSSSSRTIHLSSDTAVIALFDHLTYSVVGQSSNNAYGTVTGSNVVYYGDIVTLTATANYGYHFSHWSDGDNNVSRNIMVMSDMVLTAYFEINNYQLSVLPNDPVLGSVTGSGTYPHGTQVTVTATPFAGIRFDHWSDNSLLNTRTITLINDMQLVAVFTALDTVHFHDTTYVNIHDTTIVYVPYAVFDTMYVDVRDTTYYDVHDTIYLPIYFHDTIPMIEYLHDTIYLPQYLHDSVIINNYLHDTLYLPQYLHDTITIHNYSCDTIYLPLYIHDTTMVTNHDTTYIIQTDTVTLTEYVPVYDTIVVTDTLTMTEYVPMHDTTYINVPVHDTTIMIDTVGLMDKK